jgi:hypothetical protein
MYIPTCPLTVSNAEYLVRQRDDHFNGTPPPDFPGGEGESRHTGRADLEYVQNISNLDGLRGFGLEKWDVDQPGLSRGGVSVLTAANKILGF